MFKPILSLVLCATFLGSVACLPPPPSPVIEGVCMETYIPDGAGVDDPWARIQIKWLKLGGLSFGNGIIPLIARFNGKLEQFGQVRTAFNPLRNATDMFIELNVSKLGDQPGQPGANFLPNSLQIPLGAGSENRFKLALNNPNTTPKDFIYFAMSEASLMVGTTFQIPALDEAFSKIPVPMNLFLPIAYTDQATGVTANVVSAGMYTSPTRGQNGAGVFIDASPVMGPITDAICYGGKPR